MFEPAIDPVHWSTSAIVSLGDEVIHELAKRASATVNAYQLVVGRCLLAVDQSKLHKRMGFSGAIHYAVNVLGLGKKKARELRRVARRLEELPKLSKAAELGQVSWGKLRAIVSKASLETEDFWLRLAALRNCNEIEKLVTATEPGQLPWESVEVPAPLTRFQFHLSSEAGELFERLIQSISQEAGRPMSAGEVVEQLAIERLAKRPLTPGLVEAARKDARRGRAAARQRHSRLVQEARDLAGEALRDAELREHLAAALGGGCIVEQAAEELASPHALGKEAPVEVLEVECDEGEEWDVGRDPCLSRPLKSAARQDASPGSREGNAIDSKASRASEIDPSSTVPGGPGWDTGQKDGRLTGAARHVAGASQRESSFGGPHGPGRDEALEGEWKRHRQSERLAGETAERPSGEADWGALIERALKEKKFVLDLESDDWRNQRLRFTPKARFLTPAQRKELLRRDGHCCSNPGCPNHLWLEVHHVLAVCRNGKTASYNQVALCSRCHRNVHQGFLKITGDADLGLIFRDAQGHDIGHSHAIEVASWLNLWIGWSPGREDFHRPRLAMAG